MSLSFLFRLPGDVQTTGKTPNYEFLPDRQLLLLSASYFPARAGDQANRDLRAEVILVGTDPPCREAPPSHLLAGLLIFTSKNGPDRSNDIAARILTLGHVALVDRFYFRGGLLWERYFLNIF